ncbi:MAG: ADP-glyceromanno-heptose 6-epimerase [Saprospiraceae bacterium]|nr:ADP-glyceromanno-heptose 6-epimerase [Saprospiraceae bacterium]MBK7697411.1 ADP-glyceromanno-heptose 6-epimerase [Saprospiraceae bacterium]
MIILTGVSGFIGSCMLTALNESGYERDVVVVDDFYKVYKDKNTDGKSVREWMHRDIFLDWFEKTSQRVDFVIHLGARTDTTLMDTQVFDELNVNYSKRIWNVCALRQIPLIYASSAATYGNGDLGFSDDHDTIEKLQPLNPYGDSKHQFDLWALKQEQKPPFWIGCKFFNVYGPNEYHKARMASVVFHTFRQIKNTGKMQLFKSHKAGFADGFQSRDFIYVKDVLNMILYFMQNQQCESGIYNFGTGLARTFLDLATGTFAAMDLSPEISFIDTPEDIRETYQYFTEADMSKLKKTGYAKPFTTLEEGVNEYVREYLRKGKYY